MAGRLARQACAIVAALMLASTAHASEHAGGSADSARPNAGSLLGTPSRSLAVSARLARECQRWHAIARRLGETYAGHRFRTAVVEPNCRHQATSGRAHVWSWPWRDGSIARGLPPLHHTTFGKWEIRCARVGAIQRCALLAAFDARSITGQRAGPDIVTHFVIDRIAGRESLLWRVLVRTPSRSAPAIKRVELLTEGKRLVLPFETCGIAGCLMEADLETAGETARELSEGVPVQLELPARHRHRYRVTINGEEFGAALTELIRLRNAEASEPVRRAEH